MDFLKRIGDFFSGWFGSKKRKRIQDEMSVVGEQAYQHAKQATPEQAQPQIAPAQPATAQIQAPTPQERPKPTDLSEANQQARQLVHRPMSDQARFNQMRRGGMGHAEAQSKIQAEKDAINQQIRQKQAEERQKHQQEVKQPLLNQIEQSRQAINSVPNISQRQKDAINQRADELSKKLNYVSDLNNVKYKDWWTKDYERFANLNQRINEAYSLGKSIFDKTGDANKARQVIDQQLAHSDEMTRLEDEEKGYRDTAGAIALATQIPRDIAKTVGRYGTKLTTSGLEALGNMTNNQALANAARQGQQVLDEAVFNKLDTEYDNQLIKGLTGGVTDLGMDLVTGKAVVGALGKAGALNKVVKGADKANQFLSKQGKLSSLVGKGIQAGLGSPEAIASTATALFRHYPQNYNEVYNDARAKGVDHHQANILAHSNAVINAEIEKMNLDLSGWFKVSGATPNRGFQAIKRAVGEGAEEWTQTMSTYAIKSIYSNIDWNKAMSEANESGLMGVAVGGIADQINAHLPKVLHKIDQEVDHKISPAAQPITNALVKVELKKQITKAVQPDSQILTEAMRLNDEEVKFKLASDEHGRYVEIERNAESQQQFNDLSRNELAKQARNVLNDQRTDNPFSINQGELKGVLSGRGNKEYTRSSVPLSHDEFEAKMRLAPEIRDSLDVAEYYDSDANKKGNNLAPDGFDYYDSRFKDNGRNFINRYNIAKNNKLDTNTIYGATTFPANENWQITELDNKKTPGTPSLVDKTTPLGSVPEVSNSNIAQSDENVNPDKSYDRLLNDIKQDIADKLEHGNDLTSLQDSLKDFQDEIEDNPNLTPEQENYLTQEWWDIFSSVLDEEGYEITDDDIIVRNNQTTTYDQINDHIVNALGDMGLGDYEESRSWNKGPVPSRYAEFAGNTIHVANHDNGRVRENYLDNNDYDVRFDDDAIKTAKITADDVRADIADKMIKVLGDNGFNSIDGYDNDLLTDPQTREEGFETLSLGLNQDRYSFDPENNTLTWFDQMLQLQDSDFDDAYDLENRLLKFAQEAIYNKGHDLGIKTKLADVSNQVKSSLNELKTRHFKLTGDNDIAFNAFAEAIQDIGNIEGYYDPKTNTVHIGELAEYVLNHEVVHKTLRKHMELRPEIMQATADKFGIDNIIAEYNQKGYGEQSVNGHALDPKQPKDVRLAVEEKVADEFNTYLDQYQKGRANYYANKVGLSPTIRAWFDRIIEGLKEFFGQADKIKQFYAQLETGKFSTDDNIGALERTVSRLEDSIAYKRSPDTAKRALAGFNMVKNGWRKQATLTQLTADSAERYRQTTGLAVSDNAKLILTNNSINHIRNSGHLNGQGRYGKVDTNPLTEADIANMPLVFTEPDTIEVKSEHGYKGRKISLTKQINKTHVLGIELAEHDGDFYVITYFNKSRSPQQVQASSSVEMDADFSEEVPTSSRPKRSPEAYADNIPQTDENIKYKLSDKAQEVSDFYYNDRQSAAQLRQNLIDQLWEANKKGQGVEHIFHEAENALDDTYMVRASNNSPFYSEYFAANGKKPSKAGITAIIDEILGIENDYPTPTMTAQMWEDIAYNLGDIDGIANAYRRLLNKQEMRPETTKEAIQKAIKLRQSEQDFVNLANGVNQNNAMRSYNELSQRQAGEQQASHEKAEANSLSDDEAIKRKIMTHNLRPEHKALETAPYQVLEIYDALQKDLKRAGQNIAISDKNLNKEDVGKFKQHYKQILNEMTKLADGEVRRQRLLEAGTQIQKDLANWQKGDGATFPVLDGAISTNFLNRRAPSFSEIQNQISQWTGLNNDQSKDYLSKMLKRTGYEVDNDTIINMSGADMRMSDEELDLLKKTNNKHRLTKNKSRQIYSDKMIQALADKAADDGQTYQMIYTTNKDTNAAGILSQLGEDGDYEPTTYSPEDHYIYKGAVYQRNSNKFLGYLIQITPSAEKDGGIGQIKVWDGNTYTSSNIDFSKLQGGYDTRKNTALNLEQAAGDDVSLLAGLNAVLVDPVRQGEAKLKQEAVEVAKSLNDYEAAIKKLVGRRKSKDAMFDLVLFIEPPQSDDSGKKVDRVQYLSNAEATLRQKYGQKTFDKMVEAKQYIRTLYDDLLERENSQRLKYGMPLIKRRQDYLSHYVELSANADPVHDNLGGNLMRDIFGKQQRGSIPTVMQGLTHDTKVKKKYAGYEKHRLTDNNKPLNAFDAVRTYARTSLYNIHMMDAIAGIRGFETAIKAYEQINSLKPSHQAKLLFGDAPLDYDNKKLSNFTKFIQEHANIVAGKSSSADREALASDDGAKSLARWRKLQQITGLAKIAGNVGSFVMQPVNQGVIVAELAGEKAGLSSYAKAWGSLLADNTAVAGVRGKLFGSNIEAVWKKSNFLKSRYTDASGLSVLNSKAEKLINGIGKKTEFLGVLEQISTTQGWTAYYHQARAAGKTEAQAILIADHKANKTLTGRGIGDGAHIYNDTKAAALRQFTRETNDIWQLMATNKKNGGWNARQTLVFLAAAYGLNELMKSLRGSKATADPVAAIINELKEISDGKNALAASLDAVRGVSGEVANMHPGAQVLLAIMPDNARKMIFGKNSEIGRYGMKPAVTSVFGDSFNAAEHALSGRANKAGQSIVGMLPFGGQIKKTWEGLEAVNQGYTTNFSGRPKQEVDRTFGNIIRGALFGKTGLSGSENSSSIKNRQKEYELKQRLKKHGVNLKSVDDWSASGDMETDKKVQADLFKYKMGDDYKIHKMTNEERKKAIISGAISKQKLDEIDQKARSIKQKLGMEVKEPDKYQATVNKLKLERDYLDKAGYEQAEDRASLNQQLELAEFKLKLSKNESDRLILEAYDRMSAQGFKRFTKNDLRRFAQRQANPQDFWGKLLDLDQQQYQITGRYKLHNQNGEPDTIEQTARGRGRRKSGKINFNSGVDFSAISTKARSVGQSIKSPARGAVSYQISNNAFTYQPMSIRRSAPRLPKYSKKR